MTNKQKILKRMKNVLRGQALIVKEDVTITQKEKLEQFQVISDLMEIVLEKQYEEEKQIDINKLKEEIAHQTRNGRTDIYIKVDDFNVLNKREKVGEESRMFININYVEELIKEYEDKNSLKYEINEELER